MGFVSIPANERMNLLEYIEAAQHNINVTDSMIAVRQRLDTINQISKPSPIAQYTITPICNAIMHEKANLVYALIVYGADFRGNQTITIPGETITKTSSQLADDLPDNDGAIYIKQLLRQVIDKGQVKNWTLNPQSCPFKSYGEYVIENGRYVVENGKIKLSPGKSLEEVMRDLPPLASASSAQASSPRASSAQASSAQASTPRASSAQASSPQASSPRASSPVGPPAYDNARKYAENDLITFNGKEIGRASCRERVYA
jgi:hypothetical protein